MMEKDACIYVAGHTGMVGSAIVNRLTCDGYTNILTSPRSKTNLVVQERVWDLFHENEIEYVFMAAALVGGIKNNMKYPVEFILYNLQMQNHIFEECNRYNIKKLCFIGSSCMYPKDCPQPMKEEYLMTGPLEPTNEGYALAKLCGLKMAEYYHKEYGMNVVCPIPCNLYGSGDHFDPDKSHVMSALVKKFVDADRSGAKLLVLWGSGAARREFLNVWDAARAIVMLMNDFDSPEPINVGSGTDISILELALFVMDRVCDYDINIAWDTSMPDGMLRKCLDISKIKRMGFEPQIGLDVGVDNMIREYTEVLNNGPLDPRCY
jgi:GDP-L-fucose synthase